MTKPSVNRDVEVDFLRGVAIIGFAFWHGGFGGNYVSWCVPLFVYCTAALSTKVAPTFQRAVRQSWKVLIAVMFFWVIGWLCRTVPILDPSVKAFGRSPQLGLLWYLILHVQIIFALPLMASLGWRHVPLLLLASQIWLVTSNAFHLGFLNIPIVSWIPWVLISRGIHVRISQEIGVISVFQKWIWLATCVAMGVAAYSLSAFNSLVAQHLYEQWWYLLPLNVWAAISGALLFRLLGSGALLVSAISWIGRQTLVIYTSYSITRVYADQILENDLIRVLITLSMSLIASLVFESIYRRLIRA
jgi:hypothetical protein